MNIEPPVPPVHEHRFVFLRQEEKNMGPDRNPEWHIFDVFFCEGCLEYKKTHVRTEYLSSESFGRKVAWSKTWGVPA